MKTILTKAVLAAMAATTLVISTGGVGSAAPMPRVWCSPAAHVDGTC